MKTSEKVILCTKIVTDEWWLKFRIMLPQLGKLLITFVLALTIIGGAYWPWYVWGDSIFFGNLTSKDGISAIVFMGVAWIVQWLILRFVFRVKEKCDEMTDTAHA